MTLRSSLEKVHIGHVMDPRSPPQEDLCLFCGGSGRVDAAETDFSANDFAAPATAAAVSVLVAGPCDTGFNCLGRVGDICRRPTGDVD